MNDQRLARRAPFGDLEGLSAHRVEMRGDPARECRETCGGPPGQVGTVADVTAPSILKEMDAVGMSVFDADRETDSMIAEKVK